MKFKVMTIGESMNNKGMGLVEIILIVVIFVGLVLIFKEPIIEIITIISELLWFG